MSNPKRSLPQFLAELKRRRVARSLLLYLASGFAILEAADILIPTLELPGWTLRAVVFVLVLGIPVTITLSWFYDLTSRGVVQTPSRELDRVRDQPAGPPVPGTPWLSVRSFVLLVSLVLVGVAGGWFLEPIVLGGERGSGRQSTTPDGRPSIAVLPLESLSSDREDAFFADAIHEEVLTNLSRLGNLKVIPRISVLEYRGQGGNIREIAEELGVSAITTGTVQRDADRVRVTVHLHNAITEEELWGETYNQTVDDVFAVQADIARNVAGALAASLSPQEEARLAASPSENTEAYLAFITGAERLTRAIHALDPRGLAGAVEPLEQAVALDSTFALAYSYLSIALEWSQRVEEDSAQSGEISRRSRAAADRALSLDPDQPEAHYAMALHGSRFPGSTTRTQEDLDHLQKALEGLPNNAAVLRELSVRLERLGRIEEAAQFSAQAVEFVPRSALFQLQAAMHAVLVREYDRAENHLLLADALASDAPQGLNPLYRTRILLEFARGGGVEGVQRIFQEELERASLTPEALRNRLEEFPELMMGGAHDEFVASLSPSASDPSLSCTCFEVKAWKERLGGRPDVAQAYWDSLSVELRGAPESETGGWERALEEARAALVLARAGEGEEARQVLGAISMPTERSPAEWDFRRLRAQAYAALEDAAAALEDLQVLLRSPTGVTMESLRARLAWEPLREQPAFRSLLQG